MWGTKRYRERDEYQQLWIVRTKFLAKIPSTCAISLKRKRHNYYSKFRLNGKGY